MLSDQQLKKILAKSDIMPAEEFEKFSKEAAKSGKNLDSYLIEKKNNNF